MRVGIIGYGFVGKAVRNGLKSPEEVCIIDPKLNTKEDDLLIFNAEIIFICVPTPMNDDGSQDISILNNVINNLKRKNITCPLILKSTILPDALEDISAEIPNVVYNPEFLREKHADEDFINPSMIVIGSKDHSAINFLEYFYENFTNCNCRNFVKTDLIAASLIKFTINSFLATKVSFFNELNNLFSETKTYETWDNFIQYLSYDIRLGNSHMSVPGHDRKFGFGGACLPKDSAAFLNYAETQNIKLNLLNTAISVNNTIRQQYNNDQRESDQNINFFEKNN
jgi:UDPglucose 6-dehydrogenase